MFNRRLKRGQSYSIPVLGWREFTPFYFGAFRDGTDIVRDLPAMEIPSMLRQVFSKGYSSEVTYEYDTDVVIENGVLIYDK
jgi:CRISPR-associated protein Cas5d